MLSVVTSFGPEGWKVYGRAFVDSFYINFPGDVPLLAYWEGSRPNYGGVLLGHNLLEIEPCAGFLRRWEYSEVVAGKAEGNQPWSTKARREGYSLRHDAYKFARKVFAVAAAARRQQRGRLFWIDADVTVERKVPYDFLVSLLPEDTALCYMPRDGMHSELGFVGYNLDLLETHAFITAYEREYAEDKFGNRPYWDDCNVFDDLVRELSPSTKPIASMSRAQPFDNSILGEYMTHHKGPRKYARAAVA